MGRAQRLLGRRPGRPQPGCPETTSPESFAFERAGLNSLSTNPRKREDVADRLVGSPRQRQLPRGTARPLVHRVAAGSSRTPGRPPGGSGRFPPPGKAPGTPGADPARASGAPTPGRTHHHAGFRSLPSAGRFLPQMRYVFDFDEDSGGGRELLGGKGIGLAEMTQLGVPVPAGFTVTTDACRAYMAAAGDVPEGLDREIDERISRLEERTGKRFGDAASPLLVSVRSGAAISMPGMMDSILNLGLNDVAAEGLATSTGDARFALDSYRRLIQMYGEVVAGVDGHRFEQALTDLKATRGVDQDVDLSPDDLRELVETYKGLYEEGTGEPFPQDASDQLRRAYRAVFDSWNSPRAQVYRRTYDIPDDLGTAVNVVQMVFGNRGESSGTGVCFTRDPATGEKRLYGEFLSNAQGEDVVAGIRTPEPIEAMREKLPAGVRPARRDARAAGGALPGPPGHRVHRRGGPAVPPADAHRKADGGSRSQGRGRDGRGRADLARRGRRAHRSGAARPAPAPDDRPERGRRGRDARAERVSGSGLGRDRPRRRYRRRARQGGGGRDPRSLGDDPGRHPRADPRCRRSHRPRRHDVPRGRGRARDGKAVRRGLRGPLDRLQGGHRQDRRARARRGRSDHDRRRHGGGDHRLRPARSARDRRELRDDPGLGGRASSARRAGKRRHARRRGKGPRVRRRGDRALPHRAHVHGRRPAPDRARDDPRARRGRAPRRARPAASAAAGRLRGDLRGDGGLPGDDPAAGSSAARVPASARGGDVGGDARAHPRAPRGEPDARHPRLPARAPVPGDLRDAGARDRSRRAGPLPTEPGRRPWSRSCTRSSASARSSPDSAS